MAFGMTPMSSVYPAPAAEEFPNFLEFRANGEALGGRDADTVAFIGGRVTRGTGDNSGVVTVVLGGMTWRDVENDTVLVYADAENGVATTGTTGMQSVTVPADTGDAAADLPDGTCVVLFQDGAAPLEVQAESGVGLLYRSDTFTTRLAGQYATATLIKREANVWLLCGDLEAV